MIVLSRDEFLERTNIDLYTLFQGQDQEVELSVNSTLLRWSNILYQAVRKTSLIPIPEDPKLSELQIETIKATLCNLGVYYWNNGDMKALGQNGNAVFPDEFMEDLDSCGLIKKSLGRWARW